MMKAEQKQVVDEIQKNFDELSTNISDIPRGRTINLSKKGFWNQNNL